MELVGPPSVGVPVGRPGGGPQRHHLVTSGSALPFAWPRSRRRSTSWGRQGAGPGWAGRISPALATQAVVVEGDLDAVGVVMC